MPKEITLSELHTLLEHDDPRRIIVDVRMPFEVLGGKIKGAINIPMDQVIAEKDRLSKYRAVYLVCQSGGRSLSATLELESAGLANVYNVVGGMRMWKEKGYTMEMGQ